MFIFVSYSSITIGCASRIQGLCIRVIQGPKFKLTILTNQRDLTKKYYIKPFNVSSFQSVIFFKMIKELNVLQKNIVCVNVFKNMMILPFLQKLVCYFLSCHPCLNSQLRQPRSFLKQNNINKFYSEKLIFICSV